MSYNTQKDRWSLNELISQCVQEEERLLGDKTKNVHFASTSQNKEMKNIKGVAKGSSQLKKQKKDEKFTCYFSKKSRHMKKQCLKHNLISISNLDKTKYCKQVISLNKEFKYLCQMKFLNPWTYRTLKFVLNASRENETRKLGAERVKDVLELIHISICGLFPTTSWNGQQYFITFIDDYSRHCYLYLIHEKSQSLDVFKSFKVEVELQIGNKIKVAKSDHGGEYYGRYDGSGEQRPRPFAIFRNTPYRANLA
ncbi:hypothetical protein CR513_32151, partial [Mucuna pruriens]